MRWIVRISALTASALVASAWAYRDRTPPTFAGLASATTCIPGPVGGERTGIYHLAWTAARDNATVQSRIVYDVYQATSSGAETFAVPTYTTPHGVTRFATPPLPSNVAYYFVVRARDTAGNRDRNRRERRGMNLCY
jgi:hypothetical protein